MIAEMGQSPFLISPIVDSNDTFALFLVDQIPPANRRVKSIRIALARGGSVLWRSKYQLRLFALNDTKSELIRSTLFEKVQDLVAAQVVRPVAVPCDSAIDRVNGAVPRQAGTESNRVLSLSGWMAVSRKDGVAPDEIYVTLTDPQGKTTFLKTDRTKRQDVKNYFNYPDMPDVGYEFIAEVSGLKGNYQLGLGRLYRGELEKCTLPSFPIVMTGGSLERN